MIGYRRKVVPIRNDEQQETKRKPPNIVGSWAPSITELGKSVNEQNRRKQSIFD